MQDQAALPGLGMPRATQPRDPDCHMAILTPIHRTDDASDLRDMAERARRVARLISRAADQLALLDVARRCEEAARRLEWPAMDASPPPP